MPRAGGTITEPAKYAYQDHDADQANPAPVVQNTWYTVFDALDVRLLLCHFLQTNDETAAKDIEVRWTIDGTAYLYAGTISNNTPFWVYRNHALSVGGTQGLSISATVVLAAYWASKRGLAFKVEIRTTSVPGTNQALNCRCVRETLEET